MRSFLLRRKNDLNFCIEKPHNEEGFMLCGIEM